MYLAEKLPLLSGRKSLRNVVREGDSGIGSDKMSLGKDEDDNTILQPKMLAMAVPAFFLLCCTLFCPCFQARKKDTGHTVLSKEPNSSELSYPQTLFRSLENFLFDFRPIISFNVRVKVRFI